ncbi:hypothetical protein GALL_467780 [mine drainage metagenome]|uniref:Rod shape-determining protein MreD n=1 Tax=mine drainage metagenome TaxID=410659 RepID=A0A1J5PJ37_9ZZZZ
MVKRLISPQWAYRGLFVAICVVLILINLLPLSTATDAIPGPDLMLCLAMAWVLRRPDFVPALLIAVVFLFADLILMRPPGLWALIVLGGTEFLRGRRALTRELSLLVEWAMVSVVMIAMWLAYRLVFAVVFLPQPSLRLSAMQLAVTILAYPIVVGLSRLAFGLRKAAMGEVDALGRRI